MKRLDTVIIATVIVGFICFASLSANPVNLYWIDVSPGVNIPLEAGGNSYGSVPAGVYNVAIDMNGDGNYETFSGYCVDPNLVSSSPSPYSIINIPDADNYLQAAYIFSTWGTPSLNQAAADVQSAIWSVVGGFFFPAGLSENALNMTSEAAAAVDAGWNSTGGLALAVSPFAGAHYGEGYQDFIIRTPEPGSIFLLGLGVLGIGIAGRRIRPAIQANEKRGLEG